MIKFGTSGWRAIIADEFTLVAVRRVSQAIANWIKYRQACQRQDRRAAHPELQEGLPSKLSEAPGEFAGRRVVAVNDVDGSEFTLEDGSWLLMLPSGTEPLVRVYAEASSEQDLEVLLESGRKYILG